MELTKFANNPKVIGFEFVKNFTETYPDLFVFVHGGASPFLHILQRIDKIVILNDIDFNIIGDNHYENIYKFLEEFIIYFCKKHDLQYKIKGVYQGFDNKCNIDSIGYIYLTKNDTNLVELNYFINELDKSEVSGLEKIFGINVRLFQDEYVIQLEDYELFSDLENTSNDLEEIKMSKGKSLRKKMIIENMQQCM